MSTVPQSAPTETDSLIRRMRDKLTAFQALLLEEQDDNFLVFRNSEHQRVSVIYKRKDGNFGLIEP